MSVSLLDALLPDGDVDPCVRVQELLESCLAGRFSALFGELEGVLDDGGKVLGRLQERRTVMISFPAGRERAARWRTRC